MKLRSIAVLAALSFCASCGTSPQPKGPTATTKGPVPALAFTHGFRADPMKWAETDKTIHAAMVRCGVFMKPADGDRELVRSELKKELAKRQEEAAKGKDVGTGWIDLLEVGAELGLPEVREIAQLIYDKGKRNDKGEFGVYVIRVLCHGGFYEDDLLRKSVESLALEVPEQNPWRCCPWGPFLRLRALWYGRAVADTAAALDHLVTAVDKAANQIGSVYDKDPWGMVQLGGALDHPRARGMVLRAVPVILRDQHEDGGWGGRSFNVFRALNKHGLIEPLSELPATPPDWKIVKTIPAPSEGLRTLGWDGERILTLRRGKNSAVFAVSPDDGSVLHTIELNDEKVTGVGWHDGKLLLACRKPNSVRVADPVTGRTISTVKLLGDIVFDTSGVAPVGDRIWVCDDYCPTIWAYDPVNPGKPVEGEPATTELRPRYTPLAGPGPIDIAVVGESVWHNDWLTPLLVRSNLGGRLMDWGENPFDEVAGITYDGQQLWVLDSKNKRLCVIEKTSESTAVVPPTHLLENWLVCGPFPSEALPAGNTRERAGHNTDFLAATGGEASVRPAAGDQVARPDGSRVAWKRCRKDYVRFHLAFPDEETSPSVMYAFTSVESDAARPATIGVGSDDDVKLWLNGELVHDHQVGRGARMDSDIVEVELKQGTNSILIKVENTGGPGGFMVRFVEKRPNGSYVGVPVGEPAGQTGDADVEAALEHVERGIELEGRGDSQGALKEFAAAAKLDPSNADARLGKGKAYESIGENDLAIAEFTLAIEARPDWDEAYYRRGLVHLLKCDYDAVQKDLKKVIDIDSNSEFAQGAIENLELMENQQ